MLKKRLLLAISSSFLLVTTPLCFAANTATVVNHTNCSCQGMLPHFSSCHLLSEDEGVDMQPFNENYSAVGDKITLGETGQTPIYDSNTIMVSVDPDGMPTPVTFLGASANQTYYVISDNLGGFDSYAITNRDPC